jgi:hypothetical protein
MWGMQELHTITNRKRRITAPLSCITIEIVIP